MILCFPVGNLGPESDEDVPSFRMASTPEYPANIIRPLSVRPPEVVLVPSSSLAEAQVQTPTRSIHEGLPLPMSPLLASPTISSPIPSPTSTSRKMRHDQVFGESEELTDPSDESDYCPTPKPHSKTVKSPKLVTRRAKAPAQRVVEVDLVKRVAPVACKTQAPKLPSAKPAVRNEHPSTLDVEPSVDKTSSTAVDAHNEAVNIATRKPATRAAAKDTRRKAPDPEATSGVGHRAADIVSTEMGPIHTEAIGQNHSLSAEPVPPLAKGPRPQKAQTKAQPTVAPSTKRKADTVDELDYDLPNQTTAMKRPRIASVTPRSSLEPNIKPLVAPAKKRIPRPRRISTSSPTKSIATIHRGKHPDPEPLLPSTISSEGVAQSTADVAQDLLAKLLKARGKQPDVEPSKAVPILSLKQGQFRKIDHEAEKENIIPQCKPTPPQQASPSQSTNRPTSTHVELDEINKRISDVPHEDAAARRDASLKSPGHEEPSHDLDAGQSLLERRKAKAERAKKALGALKANALTPIVRQPPAPDSEKTFSVISIDSESESEPAKPSKSVASVTESRLTRRYGTSARTNKQPAPIATTPVSKKTVSQTLLLVEKESHLYL
jgi:hypothetical protein